ncbi:unnamed protein product [Ambrosiozyma monospora]|uniref:Unnamed protein product n=1 Tax=Ambrosiozyma monospora TaxID=43982 RepID=A0A9W6YSQ4_AMBMO|nr:unnamed protein product [Ambrosiozyma monospora]
MISDGTIHFLDKITEPYFYQFRPLIPRLIPEPVENFLISLFGSDIYYEFINLQLLKEGNEELCRDFVTKLFNFNLFSISSFFYLPQILRILQSGNVGGNVTDIPSYLIELATNLVSFLYYSKSIWLSYLTASTPSNNDSSDSRWPNLINAFLVLIQVFFLLSFYLAYRYRGVILKFGVPVLSLALYLISGKIGINSLYKYMLFLKPLNVVSSLVMMINNFVSKPKKTTRTASSYPVQTEEERKNKKKESEKHKLTSSFSYVGAFIDSIVKLKDTSNGLLFNSPLFAWGVVFFTIGLGLMYGGYISISRGEAKKSGKKGKKLE